MKGDTQMPADWESTVGDEGGSVGERDQNALLKRRFAMAQRVIKAQSAVIEELGEGLPVPISECCPSSWNEHEEAWRQYSGINGPLADH